MRSQTRCLLLPSLLLIFLASFGLSAEVEFFASPNGKCRSVIIQDIENAKAEILVACYDLSSPHIADALQRAHKRGVAVYIITDRRQPNSPHSQIKRLSQGGVPVKVDRVEALFHCKTILIDRKTILTGSYNFSRSAETRNAEHLWRLTKTDKSRALFKDWKKHWEHSGWLKTPNPLPPDPEMEIETPKPHPMPASEPERFRPFRSRRCKRCS